jgi:hypothetical protein
LPSIPETASGFPSAIFQTVMEPSSLTEAIFFPSGAKAIAVTRPVPGMVFRSLNWAWAKTGAAEMRKKEAMMRLISFLQKHSFLGFALYRCGRSPSLRLSSPSSAEVKK